MTREPPAQFDALPIEAGQQVAHLRHILGLAEEIAGSSRRSSAFGGLDEAARISAAYERSQPVTRKRFDALVEEAATWAACAVNVLLDAQRRGGSPSAAAAQLARELDAALHALGRTVQLG